MTEKKRTVYKKGSITELPKHVDKTKYGYRWLNAAKLAAMSDGYEARGFELDKNPEGNPTKREDLVLGRMPIDQFEAFKEEKDQAREDLLRLTVESQAEQESKDLHEFKKKGGRVKSNYTFTQE